MGKNNFYRSLIVLMGFPVILTSSDWHSNHDKKQDLESRISQTSPVQKKKKRGIFISGKDLSQLAACCGRHEFYGKNYPEAEITFRKGTQIDPNNLDNYWGLGVSLYHQEKIDEALENFELVIRKNQRHIGSLVMVGLIYFNRGDHQRGIGSLKKAYGIDSQDSDAKKCLLMMYGAAADDYYKKGELELAASCWEEFLKIESLSQVRDNLVLTYSQISDQRYDQEKYQECIDWRTKLIKIMPGDAPKEKNNLAQIYYSTAIACFALTGRLHHQYQDNLEPGYKKQRDYYCQQMFSFLDKALEFNPQHIKAQELKKRLCQEFKYR